MLACSLLNRPSDWGPDVAAPHQKLLGNLICIAYSPPDIFLANANPPIIPARLFSLLETMKCSIISNDFGYIPFLNDPKNHSYLTCINTSQHLS
jgi:hypothetical protein